MRVAFGADERTALSDEIAGALPRAGHDADAGEAADRAKVTDG